MANCHAEILNELLKAELAAAQTYERALAKVDREPVASELRAIRDQHKAAVGTLCLEIRQMGCEPNQECLGWEALAQAMEGGAAILENPEAIRALKQGEETGLHSYEDALHDHFLPVTSQTLIRTKLLPQVRKHITVLEQLLGT